MSIPERCRSCVWWQGRQSGDSNDPRCDREWGWSMPHLGEPRWVSYKCHVHQWGHPLPKVDDNGEELPGKSDPGPIIDAYIPINNEGLSPCILLETERGQLTFTTEELGEYLRMTPAQKKAWEARAAKLDTLTQKHIETHKKKLGVVGTISTADLQPLYARGVERIPTGLINLDWALGGGIIPGLTIGMWGDPSGGKSTLKHVMEAAILDYYKAHSPFPDDEKIVAIVSEGGSYDTAYASRFGIPTGNVLIPKFDYAEQAFQYLADIVSERGDLSDFYGPNTYSYEIPVPVRAVTVDSIDGLTLWEDVHGAKNTAKILADNNKVGAQAMLLSQYFRINGNVPSIPITSIFITQVRTKMGGTVAWDSGHRGKAYPHNIRCEIRVRAEKPKEGMTTQEVKLEFRQVQFGANVTPGDVITLAMRRTGGFFAKDQCAVMGIDHGLIEVKSGGNWSYTTRDERVIKGRGADPGKIADVLEAEGVVSEIYNRLMNALSGRDIDETGSIPVENKSITGDTTVEYDPIALEQATAVSEN